MTDLLLPGASSTHVFLRGEAIDAGYTDRQIAWLVRTGVWHRVRRGAYVDAETWATLNDVQRHGVLTRAVLRQAKTEGVPSHVSALPEYDAPVWNIPLDVVHLTRLDRRAGRNERGVHQHSGLLLPEDIVSRRGIDVVSATKTAIDITTMAEVEPSLVIVNHLFHAGHTSPAAVAERYASMDHDPNTLKTDLVLRLADPRIESVGETRTMHLCWRFGLPRPEPQFEICDSSGQFVARVDFAWPEHKVFLEFDGKQKYVEFLREGETVEDVVLREKRREEQICAVTGWRCIRVTWADLQHPERTAQRIRALLEA